MKNRTDFYIYIAVIVVALVIIGNALVLEFWSSKILPLAMGGIILCMAGAGALRAARAKDRKEIKAIGHDLGEEESARARWRHYLPTAAWFVGYFLAIYLLGFLVASPLFLLSYMKVRGSRWRQAIIVTAVTTAVIYGIFIILFKISLYGGLLFS